eukprot:GHRQ01030370.1.p1 GENE.GHRQ01030370.1~~GHRQ01030370.1.p1  ORF type:complete len:238 (-),score=41.10 GHRQ01030370.1:26-739(-)
MAVPFRAADTPDERSEFAQPDVALLLSHLAYYGDELSNKQLKAALQVRGMSAQLAVLQMWSMCCGCLRPASALVSGTHQTLTQRCLPPGDMKCSCKRCPSWQAQWLYDRDRLALRQEPHARLKYLFESCVWYAATWWVVDGRVPEMHRAAAAESSKIATGGNACCLLQVLLRLGGTEQRALYEGEWLPLSMPYIQPGGAARCTAGCSTELPCSQCLSNSYNASAHSFSRQRYLTIIQ